MTQARLFLEPEDQETQPNPDGFFANLTDSVSLSVASQLYQESCSVAVAVRVRPLVGRELSEGNRKMCIQQTESALASKNKLQIGQKSFNFDRVFWPDVRQEYIFDECTRNLVLGTFHGFNATILAYGQTGSGKTHTMGTGSSIGVPFEQVGIVPRVFKFIFDEIELRKAQSEYSEFNVKISFLELYNEELHDLLDPASMVRDKVTGKPFKELQIREEKSGVISVRGLKEQEVNSQEECIHLLNSGINHRQTSATLMNEGSSRSHAIFTITIEQKLIKEIDEGAKPQDAQGDEEGAQITEEISSKFHFVDLAGSERIKKTGATGQLLKEGISINKGLLCLGQVISALTDDKRSKEHIPYRDSKLTRILQDSLGGNSRTTMIACVSPAETNYDESLSTIKYASRARNIKNKPVVNRDPNSMLIESLRSEIQQLRFELGEYTVVIQTAGLSLPGDLSEKFTQRQKQKEVKEQAVTLQRTQSITAGPGGPGSAAEVKELKIKLSHKDKEIRELQQRLKDQQVFLESKDKTIRELEKERDSLALNSEAMAEQLKSNNIQFDPKQSSEPKGGGPSETGTIAQKSSLIEQYKAKIFKAQKDLDTRIKELQEKNSKIKQLEEQQSRDNKILKKHMEENRTLKKQLQNSSFVGHHQPHQPKEEALPAKRDFKTMRAQRKEQQQKQIEEFNKRHLDDLENQLDEIFAKVTQKKKGGSFLKPGDSLDQSTLDQTNDEETKASIEQSITVEKVDQSQLEDHELDEAEAAEKEKIIAGVREYAVRMQQDIKEMMGNGWAGHIEKLEHQKKTAENDKQEKLKKVKNDAKAIQAIEKEHQVKMEHLNSQVTKLQREKQAKEESVGKQIAMQEARIKALENDLEKQKKKREEVEKAKKFDENRFFKFKQTASKDLQTEKKKVNEKEKQVSKIKNELKKVESLAQQKISQLKGLQKRAQEERHRKEELEEKENQTRGIDIDLIKEWINQNTEAMLKHQELKEYLEKQSKAKEGIEDEMLEEGDKMTDLLMMQEKLEFEREELEAEEEPDEGRILEIEENLKDITLEISSITETLDMLEENLAYIEAQVNASLEEIEAFDIENVTSLSFNALESIESAKLTLKTFFQVFLDLNVYKRDLEQKCISQDASVLQLTSDLQRAEAKVKYMIQHGGGASGEFAAHVAKQETITQVLKQIDSDYVDNRDVEHLKLNVQEQTNLTKLSLSKIVANLKNKLKEQEVKSQSITLKLDQALKQKEIYKSRFEELKAQNKYGGGFNSKRASATPKPSSYRDPPPVQNATVGSNGSGGGHSPFGTNSGSSNRGLSFKERQAQKKQPPAPKVESLADRRKARKNVIGADGVNQSDLEKLKQDAEMILEKPTRSGSAKNLEEIKEDYAHEEEALNDLTTIKEEDDFAFPNSTTIEPGMNVSQMQKSGDGQDMSQFMREQWVMECVIDLPNNATILVDYFILSTKMICVFEDFEVQIVDLLFKRVVKTYNLQEIDGFEISEELEEDKIVSVTLEKDVGLLAVACMDMIHVFEFSEEEVEELPTHITKVHKDNIVKVFFVEYIVVLVQDLGSEYKTMIFDLESGMTEGDLRIAKESEHLILRPGDSCFYYVEKSVIGKIEVPTMTELLKIQHGHSAQVMDMNITDLNQVITTQVKSTAQFPFSSFSSQDGTIKMFNSTTGEMTMEMEGMECDQIAVLGAHLITRLGSGDERTFALWEILKEGGVREEPLDEIEITADDKAAADRALQFRMKSGNCVDSAGDEGKTVEKIISMTLLADQIQFRAVTQKLQQF